MPPTPRQRSLASAIVPTGLVAGVMDGSAAVITHYLRGGHNPERIFKYIASALLGADALTGGAGIVALGVLLHMGIAMGWTVVFFLAAARMASLHENWIPVGVGYGLFVWVAMNLVVLPLSRVKQGPFVASQVAVGAGVLVVCIGLPIAFGARSHFNRS